jgi:hypothetical protein
VVRDETLRIAFLILAHKEPRQVAQLVEVLSSDGDQVLIHLDRRSGTEGFQRLPLISERYSVTWGGFGMIRATNALLAAGKDYDFAYLLSGQCFPLRPVAWLKTQLRDGRDRIEAGRMPNPWKPLWRVHKRHANATPQWARRPLKRILNLTPRPDFTETFGLTPHGGSQWWCLSRDTVETFADFRRRRPDYDRYMRWCHVPDECYYQTLAANFSRALGPPLTMAVWAGTDGVHPRLLSLEDTARLRLGPIFAARKFAPDTASALYARSL